MILIYTNKEDVHPTRVIQHLKAWGVDVFRLNTECLLSDYEFDWQCFADGGDFHIRNICNNLELFSNQVTAIWDRRPEIPSKLFLSNEIEDVNRHILKEAHGFLNFLRYWMRDIYSIGSIVEDRPAASKMLQLMVANELGMKTPDTCFANRKGPIDKFASQYDDVLLKPISYSDILLGDIGQEYTFYAKKISSKAILNQPDEAFSQTVSFVQNYVEKAYELRITVCCDDVVACKIDSQVMDDDKGKIDWRQGYDYDLKHEIVEVPEQIKTFCHQFLEKMKLNFGCFDFIVTPEGDYVFLECNPNGQWLWIELYTGYDISKIVAKNLARYEVISENNNIYPKL